MKVVVALMLSVVAALVIATPASAETVTGDNTSPITIPTSGAGSPFPSTLAIQGADGPIADVNVRMTISHGFPDDVEVAVIAPDGQRVALLIDSCGGADFAATNLTFDQEAGSVLSPVGPCTGGTFRPSIDPGNGGSSYDPINQELSVLYGGNPNGSWDLYVQDDAGGDGGSVSSWGLTIETVGGEVAIPGTSTSGAASPYPSTKNFTAPEGEVITDADLQLTNLSHALPDDVELLLQAPGGTTALVMADACGAGVLNNLSVLFNDEAASQLPDNGPCAAASAKPSVFGPPANLPAPAPAGPYGQTLSVFDDLSGGDWRLWANDDATGETGYISEWNLVFQTRPASATGFTATTATAAEGQSATLTVTRAAPATGPATLDFVVISHNESEPGDIGAVPAQVQFARGETSKAIQIPIVAESVGEEAETFIVGLANPVDDARLSDATSFATVTIPASGADNRFTIGKKKSKANGTAKIEVNIPGPGRITTRDATDDGLVRQTTIFTDQTGTVSVKVRPAKAAKRILRGGEKLKVATEIAYTPVLGTQNVIETKVKLKDS